MDIVERLRNNGSCMSDIACCFDILNEAADEIERLHLDAALAVKRGFDLNEAYKDIERLRERDGFIAILNMQIIEKDADIERLREALKLERQLKDNALRAFNEAQAALKGNE
jgi:hypothetical protein